MSPHCPTAGNSFCRCLNGLRVPLIQLHRHDACDPSLQPLEAEAVRLPKMWIDIDAITNLPSHTEGSCAYLSPYPSLRFFPSSPSWLSASPPNPLPFWVYIKQLRWLSYSCCCVITLIDLQRDERRDWKIWVKRTWLWGLILHIAQSWH